MIRISACVIVKNEEKNMKKWLDNVKSIADEIIVVDTGSSDQTKKIAQNADAEIFDYPWQGNFAEAKNYALAQASGDWIVFLDADEYFSQDSQKNLRKYLNKIHGNYKIAGIIAELYNIDVDDNNKIISKGHQMRVFRRDKNLQFTGAIHERIQNISGKKETRIFLMQDFLIYHTGYSKNIIKSKMKRNLEMIQAEIKKNGDNKRFYGYLMNIYRYFDNYEKAVYYGELAINNMQDNDEFKVKHYNTLFESKRGLGESCQKLFSFLDRAMKECPYEAIFYIHRGTLFYQKKSYQKAMADFKSGIALYEDKKQKIKRCEDDISGECIPFAYRMIGNIFEKKGRLDLAEKAYKKSLDLWQYDDVALLCYYNAIKRTNCSKVKDKVKQIYSEKDNDFLQRTLKTVFPDETLGSIIVPADSYTRAMIDGNYPLAAEIITEDVKKIREAEKGNVNDWSKYTQQVWNLLLPTKRVAEGNEVR